MAATPADGGLDPVMAFALVGGPWGRRAMGRLASQDAGNCSHAGRGALGWSGVWYIRS